MTNPIRPAAANRSSQLDVRAEIRDLIAAMPIVIFANAIRDAFQRPQQPAQRLATVRRAVAR